MAEIQTRSAAEQFRSAAEQSRAELAALEAGAVVVEIYDQVYQLKGPDPVYIHKLAEMVDSKMRAVTSHGATVDSLRVAVLAALNIADELATLRARYEQLANSASQEKNARARVGNLAGMLDAVLDDRKVG